MVATAPPAHRWLLLEREGAWPTHALGVFPRPQAHALSEKAERAMALWPNKGESDLRPAQGQPYERVSPVAPKEAIVPDSAPAALRLPIVEVR